MSEEKDIKQETQVEEPVEQTPQAEEPKKKQKKEQRKEEALRKEIAELTDNLAKEKQQVAKEKESYLRLMAEFETFRRRSAEDRLNLISSASAKTIDDCERALEMLSKSSDEAAKEGTTLIYNKLMDYLKTQGLARIEAKGEVFNTDFHEAVTQFPAPSEDLKGKVIDVVQTGYTLGGKVLRYAKVVVGA